MVAKPDCTGQKFGMLLCLGSRQELTGKTRQTYTKIWQWKCDCGKLIELSRHYVEHNGQKSCGCLGRDRKNRVDNKRRPRDIRGVRFGNLLVLEILPIVRESNASIWKCQCDCGNVVNFNAKRLHVGNRLNCGGDAHQFGQVYPPTPSPYPLEASEIVKKYLTAINAKYRIGNIDSEIEDERMERAIRAAWIITYRRWQGEELSELFEKNYIWKYLRHANEAIKARKARQSLPIRRYTRDDLTNQIGIGMTNSIFPRVTEDILQANNDLRKKNKRFKFKTC